MRSTLNSKPHSVQSSMHLHKVPAMHLVSMSSVIESSKK